MLMTETEINPVSGHFLQDIGKFGLYSTVKANETNSPERKHAKVNKIIIFLLH